MRTVKQKSYWARLKQKAPKVPDYTCPTIDDVLVRIEKFQNKNKLLENIDEKFIGERGRINCSLRDPSGYWRWLGIQFVIGEK